MRDVARIDFTEEKVWCLQYYLNEWGFTEVELMQFTGLLDKNGKEIYEGDVVKRKVGGSYTKEMVAHVVYDDRFAMYFLQTPAGGHEVTGSLEVIGNVFENPELLKS